MFSEITIEEFNNLQNNEYQLIDIRDENEFEKDHMDGAIHMNEDEEVGDRFSREKKIIVVCKFGLRSRNYAINLSDEGYNVSSLIGGYTGYVLYNAEKLSEDEEKRKEIRKSIQKKFKGDIFNKFVKAISDYELVKEGDKIAVCISGGKDSMCMAMLFMELKRRNKFPFELVFLVMDPGYAPENRKIIEDNAKLLGIPITVFETEIFDAVYDIEKSPCYLCARMRRGYLYKKAQEMGCNKIALGHHYDDVIETVVMGMFYSGQFQAMMPKLHSSNFEGMELIRPLYLVREDDIKHWRDYNGLHFIQCACRFTETCSTCGESGTTSSKRLETKQLIAKLKETNPFVEANIFKSMENIPLYKTLGIKINGEKHSFTEFYEVDEETMNKRLKG